MGLHGRDYRRARHPHRADGACCVRRGRRDSLPCRARASARGAVTGFPSEALSVTARITRRQMLAGLSAAGLLSGTRAMASETRAVLTAADVHVDGYPTVEAVRWLGAVVPR